MDEAAEFVYRRLDEEEQEAALFHELDCPVPEDQRKLMMCRCPCPRRLLELAATKRRIVAECERQIQRADVWAPGWLLDTLHARQLLGAVASSYETHQGWREKWRP